MRLIDADFLLSYMSDMEVQTGKKCCANAVKTCIDEFFPYVVADCPTIDSETLPIVQQLRAELAEVKAERDGYKVFYKNIAACGDCNDCGISKTCEHKPMAGETTRFNCHLWKAVSTND